MSMSDNRVCVCYEKGAMVETCHLHDIPELGAQGMARKLNEECGYPRYWVSHACPDDDGGSIFHPRR